MSSSIKNKLAVIAKVAFTFLEFLIVIYILSLIKNTNWLFIFTAVFIGLTMLCAWLGNKHKKAVVPTAEELKTAMEPHMDFSNSVDWFPIISWSVMVLISWPLFWIYIKQESLFPDGLVIAVFFIIVMLPFFLAHCRNKYYIQDGVLVVQEYDLFRLSSNLRIPIESISEVSTSDLLTLTPRLVIMVEGVERRLRCTTHTRELAVAILRLQNKA